MPTVSIWFPYNEPGASSPTLETHSETGRYVRQAVRRSMPISPHVKTRRQTQPSIYILNLLSSRRKPADAAVWGRFWKVCIQAFFPPEIIVHRSPLLPRTISVLFNLGAPICHVSSSAKRRDLGRPKYKIDCSDLLLLTAIASNEILMLMTRSSTFKKSPRSQNLKTIVSSSDIFLSKSLDPNLNL